MKLLSSLVFLFVASNSYALVDMKNANYSNSWIDMEVAGPSNAYKFKVERAYNSRSLFNGMFGFGWCSEFETSLEVTPEGFLKVTDCGAGLSTVYAPKEISRADVDKTISAIISKMKEDPKIPRNEAAFNTMKGELLENAAKRAEMASKYGIAVPVKEGTKFMANGKEAESIVFEKTFYTRKFTDGRSERFGKDGKLLARYDKNGNFLKFEYEKDLLAQISDNTGRRMAFKYFPNKKVQKIQGPGGAAVEYKFANLDDLASVKNAWNNTYTYEYDELHNLTKATWPDSSHVLIKYDKKKDWVLSFTDRDRCVETYNYEMSQNDPRNHYWSTLKKVCGKDVIADNRYEFWHKQRADGQYYLERILTTIAGNTTDISYDETFGKPVSIRKNSDRTSFEYYPDGLVKVKATPQMKLTYAYDGQLKKVSSVSIMQMNEKGKQIGKTKNTEFKYDGKGNLIYAANDDGQKINMTYDPRGRIATITDQAKKVVKIEYEDRFGKPAVVTRPGLGAIKVTYKNNGDIQNVESKEGQTIAIQVASTFNNLLDIIAPATAELYL